MRIGVPTEIKEMENRVGATPAGVGELVRNGHQVCVEKDAGEGSGFNNAEVHLRVVTGDPAVLQVSWCSNWVDDKCPNHCSSQCLVETEM